MIASQYIATLLLIMLNLARVDAGEAKLVRDPFLDLRAQVRAETLCATGQWSHDGYPAYFEGSGYSWIGENLARWYGQDPFAMHYALMASKTHRANILRDKFTHVGVGYAKDCDLAVEFFGGPSSDSSEVALLKSN